MKRKKEDLTFFGLAENAKPQEAKPVELNPQEVEKDFSTIMMYQTKQRNNLLGNFSSDGKYSLTDEKMIQELILIPKKFDEKVDEVVYASTKIDDIVLNFKIELNISESYCTAKLFIIEVEHDIEEDIKHVTQLADTIEIYSPKFKEEVYKAWKVYFDEEVYDKNDFLYNYLHMQKEEYLFNVELTEILSQLYLLRMLKLLESSGELGQKLKIEYKLLLEKLIQKDPSIATDSSRLKRILDRVIMKNKALPELLKSKDALAIIAGYDAPIKRVKDKVASTMMEIGGKSSDKSAEKKDEKKVEAKKESAKKKPASKSKGASKLAKKKDDKPKGKDDKGKSGGGGGELPKKEIKKPVIKVVTPIARKITPVKINSKSKENRGDDLLAELSEKGKKNAVDVKISDEKIKRAELGSSAVINGISAEELVSNIDKDTPPKLDEKINSSPKEKLNSEKENTL